MRYSASKMPYFAKLRSMSRRAILEFLSNKLKKNTILSTQSFHIKC